MSENIQDMQIDLQIEINSEPSPKIPSTLDPSIQIVISDAENFKESIEDSKLNVIQPEENIIESMERKTECLEINKKQNEEQKIPNEENEMELEIDSIQDFGRNTTNNKRKYPKQNLRTYQDLVSVIHNKSSCEWQESRYSLPMKSFTPACFWFMVCANYFPNLNSKNKEEVYQSLISQLENKEFPLMTRLNKQTMKTIPKSDFDDQSQFFLLSEKMSRKFEEVFQIKGITDFTNNEEFCSNNRGFPLKVAYTKEDDNFITSIRKLGIEKCGQYFTEEENQSLTNYEKVMAFKQLPIDYLIELMNIDLLEMKNNNMQKIKEIKKVFFNEDIDKLLAERDYMDPENILKDLEFITSTEMEFLNYLELRQQQHLALMNMDIYDDEKNSNPSNEGNNTKYESAYDFTNGDIIQEKPINLENCALETSNFLEGTLNISQQENVKNELGNISCDNPNVSLNEEIKSSSKNQPQQATKVHKIMKDDIVCQVCNDGDYSEDNMIVFCSKCNISVHQKCYELSKIPVGDWICSLCRTFGPKGKYLRCPLCTRRAGVMKATNVDVTRMIFEHTNPSYTAYQRKCVEYFKTHLPEKTYEEENNEDQGQEKGELKNEESYEEKLFYNFQTMKDITEEEISEEPHITKIWIHLSCGLWTPEVFLEEKKANISIRGVENIDKKRFHLTCSICKAKKAGACIQCVKGKCQFSFHPECARRANHYMEIKEEEKLQYCIFCYKHTPLKLKRFLETKSKKYKKEIIKFCHNLEKFHDNYHYEQKLKETNISDKKKFIQNYISRIMKENKKKDKDYISNLLAFMKLLPENLFLINLNKKVENTVTYSIADTRIPKKIHLKNNISRSDEIWKNFKYKNLNPSQLYKRYRKIIVGTKINKNINSIKKLGNLREIADMRAIKKLMNIDKDDDYRIKERIYETRKQIKPSSGSMLNKIQMNQHLHHQKSLKKKGAILYESEMLFSEIPMEPDNTLYCVCQRVYQDGEKMIACDRCEDWLHFECIGYTGEVESQFSKELKFVCQKCDEKDEENSRVERRKEYEKLFTKYYREQRENQVVEVEETQIKEDNPGIILENEKIEEINGEANKEVQKMEIEEIKNEKDVLIPEEKIIEDKSDLIVTEKSETSKKPKILNNIDPKLIIQVDDTDEVSNEVEESLIIQDSEKRKNIKNGNSIEFNCITKEKLQKEPSNNFNNQKITKYFPIRTKSIQSQQIQFINVDSNTETSKSKGKNSLKSKKKSKFLKIKKRHQVSNIQNINIVQNFNIIQNSPNNTNFVNLTNVSQQQTPEVITPLKAGKTWNVDNITKKKKEDQQIKLDRFFITPKKKVGKNKKTNKANSKKKEKLISQALKTKGTPQEKSKNENNENNNIKKTENLAKKRGRKKKEVTQELKYKAANEIPTFVVINDIEVETDKKEGSNLVKEPSVDSKRQTRSKKKIQI